MGVVRMGQPCAGRGERSVKAIVSYCRISVILRKI